MKIAFLGFGEAGQAVVSGWGGEHADIRAFDIKTSKAGPVREAKLEDYRSHSVTACETVEEAFADCDVIFSVVTADQAFAAAKSVVPAISENTWLFDCNSCAPDTKRNSAKVIEDAGGRYIDVAVMAPVYPKLHKTPLLVCGEKIDDAMPVFQQLDMDAKSVGDHLGTASAMKLSRSIMVKGLEALTAECLMTATALGVEGYVLQSLEKSHPGFGWTTRAEQMLERIAVHGIRRAAEMDEAVNMIEGLGLPARMSRQTVNWQREIGEFAMADSANEPGLAKAVLKRVNPDWDKS